MEDPIEAEIIRILREEILLGTARSITGKMTFAELGLDSLATVQLSTAVEAFYDVDLTAGDLTADTPVTLGQLVGLVRDRLSGNPDGEPHMPAKDPAAPFVTGSNDLDASRRSIRRRSARIERLEDALVGRGSIRRAVWTVVRAGWPWLTSAFTPPAEWVILERDLMDLDITQIPPPAHVVLRPYLPADRPAVSGVWPGFLARSGGQKLDGWLADGAFGLVAEEAGGVVGLIVSSAKGERGRVSIQSERSAAWGLYLREAPQAQGRGIGLALLAASLLDARDRGYRTLLTSVRRDNSPMRAATTQLLGFRPIGRATRMVLLGRTLWRWEVEGNRGIGAQLRL